MSATMDTGQSPTKSVSQPPTKKCSQCEWKCCALLPIVLIIMAGFVLPFLVTEYTAYVGYGTVPVFNDIPGNVMSEFRRYDHDFSGYIDLKEFEFIMADLKMSFRLTPDEKRKIEEI